MNSKKNKAIIDTYTTIYTPDIVVANKYTTLKQLNKLYMFYDKVDLDESIMEGVCSCCTCRRRSDLHPVVLIKWNSDTPFYDIPDKKAYVTNTIAHESMHAVVDIYDFIGESISQENTESVAYLCGYIAECIYKTITKTK